MNWGLAFGVAGCCRYLVRGGVVGTALCFVSSVLRSKVGIIQDARLDGP